MSTLKVIPWKVPEADEPEFGDGDGPGESGRMYCEMCNSRAFAIHTDGCVTCFNCDELIALVVKESE